MRGWVLCRPARNRRCTDRGCPLGRLGCSLESCSSVSSSPTQSQALGLESTQERNNPHRTQFIHYCSHKAAVERGFFDCHDIKFIALLSILIKSSWRSYYHIFYYFLFVHEPVQSVLLNICTYSTIRHQRLWGHPKCSCLTTRDYTWHLFPTTTHTIWDQIPGGSPCHWLPDNQKYRPGQQGGTERRGHHTTRK